MKIGQPKQTCQNPVVVQIRQHPIPISWSISSHIGKQSQYLGTGVIRGSICKGSVVAKLKDLFELPDFIGATGIEKNYTGSR